MEITPIPIKNKDSKRRIRIITKLKCHAINFLAMQVVHKNNVPHHNIELHGPQKAATNAANTMLLTRKALI